jgi:hypothetical protein
MKLLVMFTYLLLLKCESFQSTRFSNTCSLFYPSSMGSFTSTQNCSAYPYLPLTPSIKVFLDKLIARLIKKLPPVYRTWRFITVLIWASMVSTFGVMESIKKKLHGLSPRANYEYTDRATVACRRSDCRLLRIEGCHVVSVTIPYGRILGLLDRSCYFFCQVVPTRPSGPRSRPTTSQEIW